MPGYYMLYSCLAMLSWMLGYPVDESWLETTMVCPDDMESCGADNMLTGVDELPSVNDGVSPRSCP